MDINMICLATIIISHVLEAEGSKYFTSYFVEKTQNKLGLSCAKLRPAWASYQLAFVWPVYKNEKFK